MSIPKIAVFRKTQNIVKPINSRLNLTGHAAFLPIFLSCLIFWPFGGSKKIELLAGDETPAAHGTVSVKNGPNKNTEMDLKVSSLAQPNSLTPSESAYVVWVQPPGENPKNEGRLRVDNNQNGQLHTEVPYKRFKLFITAEQNPQAPTPTGPQVLSADVVKA